jgi:hypothetical protein
MKLSDVLFPLFIDLVIGLENTLKGLKLTSKSYEKEIR